MKYAGFTLVETMVAIAILTIAIAGPLYATSRAAAAAYAAKDELTASYLAQEGIEYIRAMRDDTYLADYANDPENPALSSTAWDDFLNGDPGSAPTTISGCRDNRCTLDPTQNIGSSLAVCSGGNCAPLCLYSSGIYTQSATCNAPNVVTPFTRSVAFSDEGSDTDVNGNPLAERVVVTVSWKTDNLPYSVSVSDAVTPWQ